MKEDLSTREDLYLLVSSFYSRILKDVYLGPIFEKRIHNWPAHFEHLTTFWENSLFHTGKYEGNPLEIHEKVDQAEGHSINEHHFGIWLNHWTQTIDDLYEGDNASNLKIKARKMGTHIHIHLFNSRANNK